MERCLLLKGHFGNIQIIVPHTYIYTFNLLNYIDEDSDETRRHTTAAILGRALTFLVYCDRNDTYKFNAGKHYESNGLLVN